jgi:pimeloyl-ACP methyl ester carboxylesterase
MRNPLKSRSRKARLALTGVAVAALIAVPSAVAAASTGSPADPAGGRSSSAPKPTIVLEHGAWADGSSWDGVVARLQQAGYTVDVPPNPLRGASDPAYLASYLATVVGPVVLVGHSYGGAVITEAGTHPNVAALVYVCAFAPDKGESVGSLIAGFPADGPQPPILPPRNGFLFLERDKFHPSFAADLPADLAAFMADSQVPWAVDAPAGAITEASWQTKPSWYLVTTEDRMIPPTAQHSMASRIGATLTEVAASHSVYVSQPEAVATVIAQAAAGAADR